MSRKPDDTEIITMTRAQMEAAFNRWEKRVQSHPEEFAGQADIGEDFNRHYRQGTPLMHGKLCTDALLRFSGKQKGRAT